MPAELKEPEYEFTNEALRWTRNPPQAEGWYWVKRQGCRRRIFRFLKNGAPWQHAFQPHRSISTTENWEWFAGPIPVPVDHDAE